MARLNDTFLPDPEWLGSDGINPERATCEHCEEKYPQFQVHLCEDDK